MQCYNIMFNENDVKDCIQQMALNGVEQETYFNKLKEERINMFAENTNKKFDEVIENICNVIETTDSIYTLRKISEALNKLNEISKRVYFTEMEFMEIL